MNRFFLNNVILVLSINFGLFINAQDYGIGHLKLIFKDGERNRNIPVEIYYPINENDQEVLPAEEDFPVLVFGHGYATSWKYYENFWQALVPEGYIICFPNTSTSLVANQFNFANDLKFVAENMQKLNADNSSIFYNHILPKTALMGHSMGGGASLLAAENNEQIQAVVNFAAALVIGAPEIIATNVTVPTLMFSGDDDCITPERIYQMPIYENLASTCKTQVIIKNGVHCYFANKEKKCEMGEKMCNGAIVISREEQQNITFALLIPWLDGILKDNGEAILQFDELLVSNPDIEFYQECTLSVEMEEPVEN